MTADQPPDVLNRDATELLHSTMPLCKTLEISAVKLESEAVVLDMPWSPARCTSNGVLHGGAVMALADSAGGACAMLNLPDGATATSTIESKTNFLRGATSGSVRATATPLHCGRTTIVVETEIRNDDRLIAKITQTQAVLGL